jgi:hypothetical protein
VGNSSWSVVVGKLTVTPPLHNSAATPTASRHPALSQAGSRLEEDAFPAHGGYELTRAPRWIWTIKTNGPSDQKLWILSLELGSINLLVVRLYIGFHRGQYPRVSSQLNSI